MDVKDASALVFFVVAVLGAVSLMVILSGESYTANVAVPSVQKSGLGIITSADGCKIPQTPRDLIIALSEIKGAAFNPDYCLLTAQKICLKLNSGACLQECLNVVQSSDGVCGGTGTTPFSDLGGITAQVVLTPEECALLAREYDASNTRSLREVGAETQTTDAANSCSGRTESSVAKVFSAEQPFQALARNVFESGDIVGYVANDGEAPLQYALCKNGRARVSREGTDRCNSL